MTTSDHAVKPIVSKLPLVAIEIFTDKDLNDLQTT